MVVAVNSFKTASVLVVVVMVVAVNSFKTALVVVVVVAVNSFKKVVLVSAVEGAILVTVVLSAVDILETAKQ